MKASKLFKKYNELLKGDTLTESQLIALKSRISGMSYTLTSNEVSQLTDALMYDHCEYNITEAQTHKGLEYLRRKCFKNNGQPRNTKQVSNMPSCFFEAIKDFERFTFVGFTEASYNPYSGRAFYMPVWRIHTKSGGYFDYYMGQELNFEYKDYNIN